jgi:hypothetical protein
VNCVFRFWREEGCVHESEKGAQSINIQHPTPT